MQKVIIKGYIGLNHLKVLTYYELQDQLIQQLYEVSTNVSSLCLSALPPTVFVLSHAGSSHSHGIPAKDN